MLSRDHGVRESERIQMRTITFVCFAVLLSACSSDSPHAQGSASVVAPPDAAQWSLLADTSGKLIVHAIEHKSKAELLDYLRTLEPRTIALLGYVDDNGDAQALTAADLRNQPDDAKMVSIQILTVDRVWHTYFQFLAPGGEGGIDTGGFDIPGGKLMRVVVGKR